ncbi:MAG: hypothetical protein ACOYON_14825 [Fimbriimonas sp.]
MLNTLVAGLLFGVGGPSVEEIELVPTDDVWVYPHASDPMKDPFLRIWGAEGQAVAASPDAAEDYSYAYLRWDLSKLPAGALKSAKIRLVHIADPQWTDEMLKPAPLEVRALNADFVEKEWSYDKSAKVSPTKGKEAILGAGAPAFSTGKVLSFDIELKDTPAFKAAWESALKKGSLSVALTSAIDPAAVGRAGMFKLYSKDDEKAERRPKLIVQWTK